MALIFAPRINACAPRGLDPYRTNRCVIFVASSCSGCVANTMAMAYRRISSAMGICRARRDISKIRSPASTFTGAERLRATPNRQLFHIRASYKDEIEKMVEQLTTLGVNRIALFYQNDAFGEEGQEHLESALKRRNLKMAGRASYERGSVDVSSAIKVFTATDPQAIVLFAVSRAAAELVKRMQETDKVPQFLTLSLNSNEDFIKALGDHKRGVGMTQVALYPWNATQPLIKEYQQAMRETGKQQFSYNSLEAYVCGMVIGEGLRRASRNLTRARFVDALESMDRYNAGGYEIGFSGTNHIGSRHVDLTVIDGQGRFLR